MKPHPTISSRQSIDHDQQRVPLTLHSIKYELEMAYYFGQIILYQPFLHYLTKMAEGATVLRNHSARALACIKIASKTITRSELILSRGGLCPGSWTSIYTIFQAVMCLIFLVAAHIGTSRPAEAWKRSEAGIRLLAASACVEGAATKCLLIIRVCSNLTSHFVHRPRDCVTNAETDTLLIVPH